MVRVTLFQGDEVGGYTDFPDSVSVKTVKQHFLKRGYVVVILANYNDGKLRMINENNILARIEEINYTPWEQAG